MGTHSGGWGLTLCARNMAAIGQPCLSGGTWDGKQIVSSKWFWESSAEHSHWDKIHLSYGYLWRLSRAAEA